MTTTQITRFCSKLDFVENKKELFIYPLAAAYYSWVLSFNILMAPLFPMDWQCLVVWLDSGLSGKNTLQMMVPS